jgi:hypothetical protein
MGSSMASCEAGRASSAFFAGTIVWAGILVPWLGLVAVVVLVTLVVRRIRRGRLKGENTEG